jgi:Fe-S cluster assembly iron-binding protein IscA
MTEKLLKVTPAATEKIHAFFTGREVKPIRIVLNDSFCVSSGLHLSMEAPGKDDVEIVEGDYKYYIARKLLNRISPIRLDFTSTGFKFHSRVDLGPKCPGCGKEGAFCKR